MHLGLKKHPDCAYFHETRKSDNRGQKSLGHLRNVMDYLCFRTEVWRKRCYILYKRVAVPPPPQHNVENQLKLHVLVFNIVWGWGARLGR